MDKAIRFKCSRDRNEPVWYPHDAIKKTTGANLDCENAEGETPLMVAARQGYLYLSRVLLEHKPNIDKVNSKCQNVVYMAVEGNDRHVVEFTMYYNFPVFLESSRLHACTGQFK
ncbi:ankyrin repeat protein [Opisthorchis viverrini]|uniref:Ankyrin repeat protein n=1 Tax=Opisthorchis viverrini TaxID=6198 RepID=A0A1S8WW75_OPIVI|nr:ankyrin repeat protein [Opisthorchis viverrini]